MSAIRHYTITSPLLIIMLVTLSVNSSSDICQRAGINFTNIVKSIEVRVNQTANVPCGFKYHPLMNASPNMPLPFWRLVMDSGEERNLFPEALLPNFYYEERSSTLVISRVDRSLDNSSLTCCFDILRLEFEGVCASDKTFIQLIETSHNSNSAKSLYGHWMALSIILFAIAYYLAL